MERRDPEGTPTPTRVLGYLRVSTFDQVSGTSLDSQREGIGAFASSRGWSEPIFFIDDGISGASAHRPELDRLLASLATGAVVVVTAMDRLARSLRVMLDLVQRIEDSGAAFHSMREGWDTSTLMGRFGLHLVAAVAELERGLIAERTAEGRRRRQAEGIWAGGRPPFGYKRGDDGRPIQVPERAETVHLIFQMYVSERLGALRIAKELERRGVRSPSGTLQWAESRVSVILKNEAYTGLHRNGVRFDRIIDDEMWQAAIERRRTNRRVKPSVRTWPLQGRIACVCGSAWRVETGRGGRRTYFCSGRETRTRQARAGNPCTIPRQPAADLEKAVWEALVAALTDHDSFARALDTAISDLRMREAELDRGVAPVREALQAVHGERDRLMDDYVLREMARDRFVSLRLDIDAREAALKSELVALGPDVLSELESTRDLLRGAKRLQETALLRSERGLPLGVFDSSPDLAESDDVDSFRKAADWPVVRADAEDVPKALTRALDRLQAEIIAHPDRLEIRGLIAFDAVMPRQDASDPHAPRASRRSG